MSIVVYDKAYIELLFHADWSRRWYMQSNGHI